MENRVMNSPTADQIREARKAVELTQAKVKVAKQISEPEQAWTEQEKGLENTAYYVRKGAYGALESVVLSEEEIDRLCHQYGSFDGAVQEIVAHADLVDARFEQEKIPLSLTKPMLASAFGYKCLLNAAKTGQFKMESTIKGTISVVTALENACKANQKKRCR